MAGSRTSSCSSEDTSLNSMSDQIFDTTYLRGGALTLYINPNLDQSDERIFIAEYDLQHAMTTCIPNYSFGHREDPTHESWHKSITELEIAHYHVLKKSTDHDLEDITPRDAKCVFRELKRAEADRQYCQDGETQCYLTDAHASTFFKTDYAKVRDSRKNNMRAKPSVMSRNLVKRAQKEMLITIAQSFTRAFLKQMVERYLIPYLITHRYDPTENPETARPRYSIESVQIIARLFNDVIDLMLANSWIGFGVGYAIERLVIPALNKLGLPFSLEVVNSMNSHLKSVLNSIFTERFILNIAPGMFGNMLGNEMANILIRTLPKLRQDDSPSISSIPDGSSISLRSSSTTSAPGLRRRF